MKIIFKSFSLTVCLSTALLAAGVKRNEPLDGLYNQQPKRIKYEDSPRPWFLKNKTEPFLREVNPWIETLVFQTDHKNIDIAVLAKKFPNLTSITFCDNKTGRIGSIQPEDYNNAFGKHLKLSRCFGGSYDDDHDKSVLEYFTNLDPIRTAYYTEETKEFLQEFGFLESFNLAINGENPHQISISAKKNELEEYVTNFTAKTEITSLMLDDDAISDRTMISITEILRSISGSLSSLHLSSLTGMSDNAMITLAESFVDLPNITSLNVNADQESDHSVIFFARNLTFLTQLEELYINDLNDFVSDETIQALIDSLKNLPNLTRIEINSFDNGEDTKAILEPLQSRLKSLDIYNIHCEIEEIITYLKDFPSLTKLTLPCNDNKKKDKLKNGLPHLKIRFS